MNNPNIYIYNIESIYNLALFPVCISNDDTIDINDNSNSSQYSLEIKIHALINNYIHKSDNINNCDIIYIPIYTFLLAWKNKFIYNVSIIVQKLN